MILPDTLQIRKLAKQKQMEKKVDGGGDIIEVHQRLEEDVDESGNEQNNVPDSNNVEKQQESDNEATIAGETVRFLGLFCNRFKVNWLVQLLPLERANQLVTQRADDIICQIKS